MVEILIDELSSNDVLIIDNGDITNSLNLPETNKIWNIATLSDGAKPILFLNKRDDASEFIHYYFCGYMSVINNDGN